MPRIRTIKPQFWIDEDLAKVQRDVRLLYIGLWNICDDGGVFEWRPGRIKAQLFPNDNDLSPEMVEKWLNDLVNIGNVKKFGINGAVFGFIPTLTIHQEIYKPSKFRFAEPPADMISHLPVAYLSPTSSLPVTYQSLKEKEKEKEKEKYKGKDIDISKKIDIYINMFLSIKEDVASKFTDLDVDFEIERCATWWVESRKLLKRPKTALTNWLIKSRQYKQENNGNSGKQPIKHQSDVRIIS